MYFTMLSVAQILYRQNDTTSKQWNGGNVEKVGRGVTEGSIPAFSWKKKNLIQAKKKPKLG